MMRSPRCLTVAVRRKSNEIVLREQPWRSIVPESGPARSPSCAGALVLFESMRNGYGALRFSAAGSLSKTSPSRSAAAPGRRLVGMAAAGHRCPSGCWWSVCRSSSPGARGTSSRAGSPWPTRGFTSSRASSSSHRHRHDAADAATPRCTGFSVPRGRAQGDRGPRGGPAAHVENARRFTTRHARCGTTFLMVVVLVSVGVFALVLPPSSRTTAGFFNVLASIA
jgi:hypothetical protein